MLVAARGGGSYPLNLFVLLSCRCFLENSADYLRVLRSRRRVSHRCWRLSYVGRSSSATPRFGVVVAKRHVPAAVQRNRIRRMLREYFRQQLRFSLPAMDFLMQTTCVLSLSSFSGEQLREECLTLFTNAINKPL